MRVLRFVLVLTLVTATAGAQSPGDRDAVAEIRRLRASSNAAIARHDTAGFGAILAPNFSIVSSYSNHESGRDTHVSSIAATFASRPTVVYVRTPDEVRVYAPWEMASERGHWTGTWTDGQDRIRITGSYFAKWRKVGGAWRVESETYVPEACTGGAYCATPPK